MTFQLNVGQKGTLRVQATAADGTIKSLPADLAASSSNASINFVSPGTTAGDFTVTALAAGSEDITVTGTNENGQPVSAVATFTDSVVTDSNPTTGFSFTLVNVGPA
jgi:uncharacterized protein YjdB